MNKENDSPRDPQLVPSPEMTKKPPLHCDDDIPGNQKRGTATLKLTPFTPNPIARQNTPTK